MHFSNVWRGIVPVLAVLALGNPAPAQDAALQREIDAALRSGVAHLKSLQKPNGAWPREARGLGPTSLVAWTLLECGVAANDPLIEKAADAVRRAVIDNNETYDLACAVFFLDKLGDPQDERLIWSLGLRLLGGQNQRGDWAYICPGPPAAEVASLQEWLKNRKPFQPPKVAAGKEGEPKAPKDWRLLPREILQQAAYYANPKNRVANSGDVSNTQFAMIALWVARRHGLPVESALATTDAYFRQTQTRTGGWSYVAALIPEVEIRADHMPSPAMTCAGLIGLSFYYAVAREKAVKVDINQDLAVRAGLHVVGAYIGDPLGDRAKAPILGEAGKTYYYLWTLERMAVLYDLKTIGGKNWYVWGAELLVANQQGDGSWAGDYKDGGCDTCFALLFLRRANLAKDVTSKIGGSVKDPGRPPPELLMAIEKDFTPGVSSGGKKVTLESNPAKSPPEKPDPVPAKPLDPAQLAADLVAASGNAQEQLLSKYREPADAVYTFAIAAALGKLKGEIRVKARAMFVERLTKEPVGALRAFLTTDDLELRRGAALACGQKKARDAVGELIALLEDSEIPVHQAAHQALRQITGQDFGPEPDASNQERRAAAAAWREWWKKNQ